MDRLKAIESFVRVVRTGGFTAAARQLGTSRALISHHVMQLEKSLGVRLLHRTTKRVKPTEIGQHFYETCSHVLSELEDTELALRNLQQHPQGTVRVLCNKSLGVLQIAPVLCDFNAAYPDIQVSLFLNENFLDLVENRFDMAVVLGALKDSSLIHRRIASIPWIACAAPAYLATHGEPSSPEELARHTCINHLTLTPDRVWTFRAANDETIKARVPAALSSNSTMVLRQCVLRGMGIALLPGYSIEQDRKDGRVVPILQGYRIFSRPLSIVYPHSQNLPFKVRLLSDFLAERFRNSPSTVIETGVAEATPNEAGP